jgi:hypothetical protein
MRRPAAVVATLVLAATSLSACGSGGGSAMPGTSSASSSSASAEPEPSDTATSPPSSVAPRDGDRTLSPIPPPTLPPPKNGPTGPTDNLPGNVVGGRVVKGGSGPCYAVLTDDGRRFALHSDAGLTLEEGSYIVAKVGPLRAKIDCGEGVPRALISFKRQ